MTSWLACALLPMAPAVHAVEAYGVTGGDSHAACLATRRPLPRLPLPLRVVATAPERRVLQARAVARLKGPCRALADAGLAGPFYALRLAPADGPWLGIADFGAPPGAAFGDCTAPRACT